MLHTVVCYSEPVVGATLRAPQAGAAEVARMRFRVPRAILLHPLDRVTHKTVEQRDGLAEVRGDLRISSTSRDIVVVGFGQEVTHAVAVAD
jgi:hypothetical protein